MAGLCLGVLVLVFGIPPVRAADDAFTISDVAVDVTAGSALEARTRAMAQGQSAAFRRLMERLLAPADLTRVPAVGDSVLLDLIQDVAVDKEKASAVRYIASLSVHFKPSAVRGFLRGRNISFTEPVMNPVAVIPVFQGRLDSLPELWEDSNRWRAAWLAHPPTAGVVPTVLPAGDADNLAAITTEKAVAGDVQMLRAVAKKQNASSAVVAHVVVVAASPPELQLRLAGPPPYGGSEPHRIAGTPGESLESLLARAVQETAATLEESWRRASGGTAGAQAQPTAQITAMASLASLEDWLSLRRSLAAIPALQTWRVQAITRTQVQLVFKFNGDEDRLTRAFTERGLRLERGPELWTVSRTVPVPVQVQVQVPASMPVQTPPPVVVE
ncbi:MAG: DUF2066 domain-containing protein [Alphaproteobacteria bacterium]